MPLKQIKGQGQVPVCFEGILLNRDERTHSPPLRATLMSAVLNATRKSDRTPLALNESGPFLANSAATRILRALHQGLEHQQFLVEDAKLRLPEQGTALARQEIVRGSLAHEEHKRVLDREAKESALRNQHSDT